MGAGASVPPVVVPNVAACSASVGPPIPPAAVVAVLAATVRLPARYGDGFWAVPPCRTSKWVWGPVQRPVQPTSPIFCPALTYSLTLTSRCDKCA